MLPVLLMIFIFCYIPMYGIIISFQNYTPGAPFLAFDGSVEWVGLKHFISFIQGKYFFRLMSNTILLSLYNLIFGFWVPIAFAVMLNQVSGMRFKKIVQTATYLPYFISSVVVAGMLLMFIRPTGIVNQIIMLLGGEAKDLSMDSKMFPVYYTLTNIWKSFGFNSILYMSTMSTIDPELYESSSLDGANRLKQIWHVTLPGIRPTISIMLIMAVGGILSSNTDLILLIYNPSTYKTADVIGTYIYRDGIINGRFSFSSAVGMFSAIINFILLFAANKISNKINDTGLW